MGTESILATYAAATDDERAEGMAWYWQARLFADALTARYGVDGAAIVAVLSPRREWLSNVRDAVRLCATGQCGAMHRNRDKARRIVAGETADAVLSGDKVRSFYACIVAAGDTEAVCVDRHAYDVTVGRLTDNSTRKRALGRRGGYEAVADQYRQAATIVGTLTACQLQAVCWLVWRNRKAVR